MTGRVTRATADDSSGSPAASPSIADLEEKASRLLKRCRYSDAAKTFDLVVREIQLQRHTATSVGWSSGSGSTIASDRSLFREVGALEGLAICLSRQLDDAGAEVAQRKALALRCQQWERLRKPAPGGPGSSSDSETPSKVLEAKRAALPCLRNLASFVSNQGRHVDAEVVLRTVLSILEHPGEDQDVDGKGKSAARSVPVSAGGRDRLDGILSGVALPRRSFSENGDARPSGGVEEEKRSHKEEEGTEEEEKRGGEEVEEQRPRRKEDRGSFPSLSLSSSPCEACGGGGGGGAEAGRTQTSDKKRMTVSTASVSPTGASPGRRETGASLRGFTVATGGADDMSTGAATTPAATAPTTTRDQVQSSPPCVGAEFGPGAGEERGVGGVGGGGDAAGEARATLAERTASEAVATAARAMSAIGATAALRRGSPSPSSPARLADRREGDNHPATDGEVGAPPDPPPPSPVPVAKHGEGSGGRGCGDGGDGGSCSRRSSGSERAERAGSFGGGGGGGGGRSRGFSGSEDAEDVEMEDVGKGAQDEEEPEQMAAVTRHHLAVVVHARGRVKEAEVLLEDSLRVLKQRDPPEAVWVAQALHDLAGIARPSDPARACALYREALELLEGSRGVNHFLTAPTLAKLGSLLGESLVAASSTPPAPAAPAGPGAAGLARSAGLAEAVCAPAGKPAGGSAASAVAAAARGGWDAKEAENMIKRAVLIQGRHLGLRHPAVASSMRAMAELYRRQGRLSEAEPLFRRAIGIWEVSPGPMDSDAVAALHGLAHCVLAGAGADWLGRFEEAFALVDQAYRVATSHPGNGSSARLLLEALRMIRSRQRQGRGDPQPASAAIMEGVWNGRWDPTKNCGGDKEGHIGTPSGSGGSGGGGDSSRCAVCLEEVVERGGDLSVEGGVIVAGVARDAWGDWTADIGTEEGAGAQTGDAYIRGSFAYLPCGHRFHTYCIGRWLAHSSSCPSCRRRIEDDKGDDEQTEEERETRTSSPAVAAVDPPAGGGGGESSSTAGAGVQAAADTPARGGDVWVVSRRWPHAESVEADADAEAAIDGESEGSDGGGDGDAGVDVDAFSTRSIGTQVGVTGDGRSGTEGGGQPGAPGARAPFC